MVTFDYRRTGPLAVTLVCGLLLFAQYWINYPELKPVADAITTSAVTIFGYALIVGNLSLVRWQGALLKQRKMPQAGYSVLCLATMAIFITIGIATSPTSKEYTFIFNAIYAPSSMALWSLHGFWITSATYRAYRVRSTDAMMLFACGMVMLLAVAPWGSLISPNFIPAGDMLMEFITKPAMSGIIIGVGIGTVIIGLRAILGFEKSYLGAG